MYFFPLSFRRFQILIAVLGLLSLIAKFLICYKTINSVAFLKA